MMKSKIPTLLAIFILIAATLSVVFTISELHQINSNAATPVSPKDVKITNIKDSSFTVSWLTEDASVGFVKYTDQNGVSNQTAPTANLKTHLLTIQNLNPASNYSVIINSSGQFFDNNNIAWTIQTLPSQVSGNGTIISGQVLDTNNFPAKNALVYVDTGRDTYATSVSPSGSWLIALPSFPETTILNILVENSTSEMASAKIDLKSANPIPTIILGNSYDFRNQNTNNTNDVPKVEINLPTN